MESLSDQLRANISAANAGQIGQRVGMPVAWDLRDSTRCCQILYYVIWLFGSVHTFGISSIAGCEI